MVKVFIIAGMIQLLFFPTFGDWKESDNKFKSWLGKMIRRFLKVNLYLRLMFSCYLFAWLHVFIELFNSPNRSFSYLWAWLLFGVLTLFIGVIPLWAFIRRKDKKYLKDGIFKPVFEGLRDRGIVMNCVYPIVYLLRRIAVAFFIAAFKATSHWLRTPTFTFLSLGALVFICIWRPYQNKTYNIFLIINESLLFSVSMLFFVLHDDDWFHRWLEWVVVIIFFIYTLVYFSFIVIGFVIHVSGVIKRLVSQSKPDDIEEYEKNRLFALRPDHVEEQEVVIGEPMEPAAPVTVKDEGNIKMKDDISEEPDVIDEEIVERNMPAYEKDSRPKKMY